MSGSWDAMLADEQTRSDLERRRELSRLTKPELVRMVLEREISLEQTTEHEIGRQDA